MVAVAEIWRVRIRDREAPIVADAVQTCPTMGAGANGEAWRDPIRMVLGLYAGRSEPRPYNPHAKLACYLDE